MLIGLGGGLVIGLSAGLLAPVIGAGLGAAFATVGISGTTGFLAGAGGAAVITTTGVFTGANIAGRGMAKRTREVRTFEFRPIHNLKRVSCYICVPGYVRLVPLFLPYLPFPCFVSPPPVPPTLHLSKPGFQLLPWFSTA